MAASANSIKKAMKLERQPDGTLDMIIHVQMRPNGLAYVDGRPCGDFDANPARAAQGVTETVVATVTEFVKAAPSAFPPPTFTPPAKLDKAALAKNLAGKTERTNLSAERAALAQKIMDYGLKSKDPGWKYLASLTPMQISTIIGSHVETFEGACKKLAEGGALPDRR
jgi:hypothetical protein